MLRYARDWGLSIGIAVLVYLAIGWFRPKPDLPDEAPDFTLLNLEGEAVTLSDYRGQWVVLNFWATWCGPCRTEIPAFSEFADENPDVVVLGVATDGKAETLIPAAQDLGITYPVLVDPDGISASLYKVNTIPTTVVVSPEGTIETIHVGIMMGWQIALAVD
jgi:peroxiredoxin